MQPEAVDLSKAGRSSGRAFQQDSFHQYMARKIDLQRKQFGLVIPPPPPPVSPPKMASKASSSSSSPGNKSSSRTVRFRELPVRKASRDTKTAIGSIIHRLQRRHGRGHKRLGRKRKRQEMTGAKNRESESNFMDTDKCKECHTMEKNHLQIKDSITALGDEEEEETAATPSKGNDLSSNSSPSPSFLRQSRPDLFFLGIVVKVNGYTNPDNCTLKRMLQKHGGDFETYETNRVTHIIAETLSKAKADMYKRQRKPRPICTPAWIVESVEQGKLLPHGKYLLQELLPDTKHPQMGIRALFASAAEEKAVGPKSILKQNAPPKSPPPLPLQKDQFTITDSNESRISNPKFLTQKDGKHNAVPDEALLKPQTNYNEHGPKSPPLGEVVASPNSTKTAPNLEHSKHPDNSQNTNGFEERLAVPSDLDKTNNQTPRTPPHTTGKTDAKYINGKIRTVGTDPNFLDSFFKNSRLCFIGSYKQRITAVDSPSKAAVAQNSKDFKKRLVFHVDMDCFFAAVALRNFPQYKNKPVAISHHGKRQDTGGPEPPISKNSSSECATCNYKAREYGIKVTISFVFFVVFDSMLPILTSRYFGKYRKECF